MGSDTKPEAQDQDEKQNLRIESEREKALAYVRRWVGLRFCQRHFRDNPVPGIRAFVERPVAERGRELVGSLLGLVWWYEHEGIRLILEGDPAGWPTFANAWKLIELLASLEARLHTAAVRKLLGMPPPTADMESGSRFLYYSSHAYASATLLSYIAIGDREGADALAGHLHRAAGHFTYGIDPLNIFMARRLLGQPTDGPYHQLSFFPESKKAIAQWDEDDGAVEALIRSKLKFLGHAGFHPGDEEGYFPSAFMAIAAISRVRRHEGRPCTVPDHALLRTPLTQVPEHIDYALPAWYAPLADLIRKLD